MDSKQGAQQRAEQIAAFNDEVKLLQEEGIWQIPSADKQHIAQHHATLLVSLAEQFNIDVNPTEKQLSLGMKVVTFLGSLAFAASIFFLFYQFWGYLGTPLQVMFLVAAPQLTLICTAVFRHKEVSGYFAKLAGLITLACFVINLSMLGQIFNISPSPNAFLVWAIFALGLAYYVQSRLLLALSILLFTAFLSAKMGIWTGVYWVYMGERPENFLLPALLVFVFGVCAQSRFAGFAQIQRLFGAIIMLLAILVLSHWAGGSHLNWSNDVIEGMYQVLGFLVAGGTIALGIKYGWKESVNVGAVFFTVFLYSKFYDWWWHWFPKYLFFLVIALTSVLMLLVFKRLRQQNHTIKGEGNVE